MWPTLIAFGPLVIHSFGFLLALGVFFGGFVFWQKGREEGTAEEELMDCWLVSGIVSLLTARVWFVLTNWGQFNNWYRIIFLTKFPGLAYEGAFFGFWLIVVIWAVRKHWPWWPILETAVFAELIVEIFGRLGRWLAVGTIKMPFELIFSASLALFYFIFKKWEKKYRSAFKPGFLVAAYLLVLGTINALVTLWFGLILVIGGYLLLINRWGKLAELFKKQPVAIKKHNRKKLGFDFK
ncbi:MAG: prolipoprotein diacylglyceryl transferase [Candidatus Beckwithbacteria bacterium]|nr:prolipoprotein diacylglyceryl transferase [Candidatus Beckwithbacteria bacterium]